MMSAMSWQVPLVIWTPGSLRGVVSGVGEVVHGLGHAPGDSPVVLVHTDRRGRLVPSGKAATLRGIFGHMLDRDTPPGPRAGTRTEASSTTC